MQFRLSKTKVGGCALRTNEVVGVLKEMPAVGKRLVLYAKPLDPTKNLRVVETNVIVDIALCPCPAYSAILTTASGSVYELDQVVIE